MKNAEVNKKKFLLSAIKLVCKRDHPSNSGKSILIVQYQSIDEYCASLAHKLNHSFTPNCEWDNAHHPVFGLVPAVR
jgi:hypothetical protein